jgi:multicomponent Na+:H+ antiporter subunit F
MTGASEAVVFAARIALAMLVVALLLALFRLVRGPSIPDRVVTLDLITTTSAGILVTYCLISGESAFLDVAIAVSLIAFLGTIAFASYLEKGGRR